MFSQMRVLFEGGFYLENVFPDAGSIRGRVVFRKRFPRCGFYLEDVFPDAGSIRGRVVLDGGLYSKKYSYFLSLIHI